MYIMEEPGVNLYPPEAVMRGREVAPAKAAIGAAFRGLRERIGHLARP